MVRDPRHRYPSSGSARAAQTPGLTGQDSRLPFTSHNGQRGAAAAGGDSHPDPFRSEEYLVANSAPQGRRHSAISDSSSAAYSMRSLSKSSHNQTAHTGATRQTRADSAMSARDHEFGSGGDANVSASTMNSTAVSKGANVRVAQGDDARTQHTYRTYKRRWFGLVQLALLNLIVSWDWLSFAAVSKTSSQYFKVSETAINWLSTGFLLAFVVASPATAYFLHRGPKDSIIVCSALILVGNWVRYGGAKANHFGVTMFGQILVGFAQPFVLTVPTTYSDLWFTEGGRTTATAIATLANPLGGALGQLFSPAFVNRDDPTSVPSMVLYVSIISSIATIPSFFIPARPPTPVAASSTVAKTSWRDTIRLLFSNRTFWIVFIVFTILVAAFNSISALINQILYPYGFTEDEAGIAGAVLILVGIVASIIVSIINDRVHAYLGLIKTLVPICAAAYLAFIWAPATRSIAAPYVILAILGAASFSLLPLSLEYATEATFPVGPEMSSVVLWASGQLGGALFTIIMDALKDPGKVPDGSDGRKPEPGSRPPANMYRGLVFQAVFVCVPSVLVFGLGVKRLGTGGDARKRFAMDGGRSSSPA